MRARGAMFAATATLVAALAAAVIVIAVANPLLAGDTTQVVHGAANSVHCLRHDVYTGCNARLSHGAHVGPWPLLQYAPAIVMQLFGASKESTLRVLIALDALAIAALIAVGWRSLRRLGRPQLALLFVLAVVTSPLWWYGISAFGEALAAAVIVFAMASLALRRHPLVIGALFMWAAFTKETNFVFVAALAGAYMAGDPHVRSKRYAIAAFGGLAVGVACNMAFNVFRYGTVRNTDYLHGYDRVQDVATGARSFAALWVAPNGGTLWFWPVALAVTALLLLVAAKHSRVAVGAAAGVLVLNAASLAAWYSPFGWLAWGPRLSLPMIPAVLFTMCALARDTDVQRVVSSRWMIFAGVVAFVAALPQIAVLFDHEVLHRFFANNAPCVGAHITTAPARYYRCLDYLAWRRRPGMLQTALDNAGRPGPVVAAILLAGTIAALVATMRSARGAPIDR